MNADDRQRVAFELYEWGLSTSQIAQILSLAQPTVREYVKAHGVVIGRGYGGRKVHWPRVDRVLLSITDGLGVLEALRAAGFWLPMMASEGGP